MNHKHIVQTTLLAVLFVSPAIVLLAMQMPFWLPARPVALKRLVYADFDSQCDVHAPAVTGEADTSACKCVLQHDVCEVIRTSIGADGVWNSLPLEFLRFDFAIPLPKASFEIEAFRLRADLSF